MLGSVRRSETNLGPTGVARAGLELQTMGHGRHDLRLFIAQLRDRAVGVPGGPVGLLVRVEQDDSILEVNRRPEPEELGGRLNGPQVVALTHRADPPGAVSRPENRRSCDLGPFTVDLDPPLVVPVLRESRQIHERSGTQASEEAGLLDHPSPGVKRQVSAEPVLVLAHPNTQCPQRLDDLDLDGADTRIHALHPEGAGGEDAVLNAATYDAEGPIHDVEIRVDPERSREVELPRPVVPVEEVAVVEVPARPGVRDGLGRLVDRVVVASAEHLVSGPDSTSPGAV